MSHILLKFRLIMAKTAVIRAGSVCKSLGSAWLRRGDD
jgi:hypothetical protein